jgi:hypothetical protein
MGGSSCGVKQVVAADAADEVLWRREVLYRTCGQHLQGKHVSPTVIPKSILKIPAPLLNFFGATMPNQLALLLQGLEKFEAKALGKVRKCKATPFTV